MMLVQVTAPHFCAGVVLKNERVVRAAPILEWAMLWERKALSSYFRRKRWKAVVIKRWSDSQQQFGPGGAKTP